MKVAIIPAYNEADTIGTVVLRTKKHVDKVIVVDDGSTDKTAEVAKLAGAEVIQHTPNGGKGSALKTGFKFVQKLHADVVVCVDGDAQHNPDDIPKLLAPILNGEAEMVIGSRYLYKDHKKEIPFYRRLGQWVLTSTSNCGAEEKITDSQSGFRAFSGDVIDKFRFKQTGFSIESEMFNDAIENNIKIIEVPISMRYKGLDTSTETPGKHGFGVLNYILKIVMEKRPLLFFGVSGMILLVFGLLFGLYSLNFYFINNNMPFGPSLLAAILILLGVLSVFAGMILNSIRIMIQGQAQMDKHREELLLKNISEQLNQKIVPMTPSQASALLLGIDEKITQGLSTWGSNQKMVSPKYIDAFGLPWFYTMNNLQFSILLELIKQEKVLGLTSSNSYRVDQLQEPNDQNSISSLPVSYDEELEVSVGNSEDEENSNVVKVRTGG